MHLYAWILTLFEIVEAQSVVRIGHLSPANPITAYESDVLKFCAKDLRKRNIIPANFTLEYA